MSDDLGQVKFPNGKIMHYKYCGIVAMAAQKLWQTKTELLSNWNSKADLILRECNCGREEPVEIATRYGNGFWWEGRACQHCQIITYARGLGDYAVADNEDLGFVTFDGLPVWWEQRSGGEGSYGAPLRNV